MFCGECSQQMNPDARFAASGRPMQPVQATSYCGGGRMVRRVMERMIGGVCVGFAEHFGWDPTLVRVLTVLLFFLGCGSIFIAYIVAWIIMPQQPLVWMTPPPRRLIRR